MPAAVTAMVVGAGISTDICGSMRGSQTFDMNCQNKITTAKKIKFGKANTAPNNHMRNRTPSGAAAGEAGGACASSIGADLSGPFIGAWRLLCICYVIRPCAVHHRHNAR